MRIDGLHFCSIRFGSQGTSFWHFVACLYGETPQSTGQLVGAFIVLSELLRVLALTVRWLLAVVLGLLSLAGLASSYYRGTIMMMGALILLPPVGKKLGRALQVFSKGKRQTAFGLGLWILGLATGPFLPSGRTLYGNHQNSSNSPANTLSATQWLAHFNARILANDLQGAANIGDTLTTEYSGTTESASIAGKLSEIKTTINAERFAREKATDAINAERLAAEKAAAITNAELRSKQIKQLKREMSSLHKKRDDVEKVTFYHHPDVKMDFPGNYFGLYMVTPSSAPPYLRWKFMYADDDWLFIEALTLSIDNEPNIKIPCSFAMERDHSGGRVWEWHDEVVKSDKDLSIFARIAQAAKVTLRFEGRQYYKDRVLSTKEKQAMLKMMEVYKARKAIIAFPDGP